MQALLQSSTVRNALGTYLLSLLVIVGGPVSRNEVFSREDFSALGAATYLLYGTIRGRVTAAGPLDAPRALGGTRTDIVDL